MILLVQGSDMINCLKQVVQFGLNKQIHVAGTQQELESLAALPPKHASASGCSNGTGSSRAFPASRSSSRYSQGQQRQRAHCASTVRYVSAMSFALVANREKSIDALKLATALETSSCRTMSNCNRTSAITARAYHQLMTSAFVGEAQSKGKDDPEDLYRVTKLPGRQDGAAVSETGCTIQWPA